MYFIGIDNGVSGSIGILDNGNEWVRFVRTPIKNELSYTKVKQNINRVDVPLLIEFLRPFTQNCFVMLERPMINPMRFKATISALRALEATIIAFEMLKVPYSYLDSKEWQKALLPAGLSGIELKNASLQIAKRLFPTVNYGRFKDADGLLIAEHCRRLKK